MSELIKKIAVVGTGTLGTQIAMQAANANYQVKVFDVKKEILGFCFNRVWRAIKREVLGM